MINALLNHPNMFGFCCIRLYGVEQEANELYTYDRQPKFDLIVFHAIHTRRAAIEE